MITMKKKVFLMALVGAALTACSNHDDVYSPEKYAEAKLQAKVAEYNAAFQKEFGTPAPGHTWGFGKITRSVNTESHRWFDENQMNLQKPADITDAERKYVMEWFANHGKQDGTTFDFHDYFIQNIGYSGKQYSFEGKVFEKIENGEEVYRTEKVTVDAKNHMNLVCANLNEDGSNNEHINNFNATSGEMMLLLDSETKYGFGFEDSWGTADKYVAQNYLLAVIDVPGVGVGYYVGLDYQTRKSEYKNGELYYPFDLKPDGVYDDRVMKIVPAKVKSNELFQVWCEDLGGEYGKNGNDFDFNDVVLSFVKNGNNTEIWLLAAGGTMKLDVVWNGESKEVHEAFGVETSVMVNTGRKDVEKKLLWTVPNTIVTRDDLNSKLQIKVMDKETGVWYTLNNSSAAPQMIVCEPEVLWPNERVNINDAFADDAFNNWVTSEPSKPFNGRRK